MAEWSRNKVDSSNLNEGKEWTIDDQVALEELNAMTNSGLYAQDFAEKLVENIDTSEAGKVGTPSVSLVAGDGATAQKPYKKFKFSNLKGDKGDTGSAAGFGTPTASVDANIGTPSVTVTASGGDTAKVFDFKFKNLKGQKGDIGVTPNVSATATTLPAGSEVTVTKSGTAESPAFAFGIPKGDTGATGPQGPQGEKGDTGATGAKGDQGLGMYRTSIELTTSSTSVSGNFFDTKPSAKWQVGDMILDPNGLVFAVTAATDLTATRIPIEYKMSIKGAKGDKGDKGDSGEVYQTTGTSTTGAMSQKATTDELAKKMDKSGGKFTGEVKFNEVDGQCINYDSGFYINKKNGSTLVGTNGTAAWVGTPDTALTMRGNATRPTYNGKEVALVEDVPQKRQVLWSGELVLARTAGLSDASLPISIGDKVEVELEFQTGRKIIYQGFVYGAGATENSTYAGKPCINLSFVADCFTLSNINTDQVRIMGFPIITISDSQIWTGGKRLAYKSGTNAFTWASFAPTLRKITKIID